MASFAVRAGQHDGPALAAVIRTFQAEGFCNFRFGLETDGVTLRDVLQCHDDPTSILLRYRPDQVFSRPDSRTVLCELKSESKGYPNFAVEADAYLAGRAWNHLYRHVMYAFCDLQRCEYWACWADAIPEPGIVYVPERHRRFAEHMARLPKAFPRARVTSLNWGEGSGTPYFFVPKPRSSPWTPLRPLDWFVRHEVWAAVTALTPITRRAKSDAGSGRSGGQLPLGLDFGGTE